MDDERQRAEEWLEQELAPLREIMSTEEGRVGARMSYDEFAAQQRQLMEWLLLPLDHYLGLTIPEAEEVARSEGRILVDRTRSLGGRMNWVSHRLNVWTGPDGRIVEAHTDGKPWDAPPWEPPSENPPQMTDDGSTLDLFTAENISAALTEIGRALPAGVLKPSPQQAVASGFVDVRYSDGRMICRYDPDVADPAAWDRALRERLGAEAADYVQYVPIAGPGRLAELMSVVGNRSWHPDAATVDLSAGIDWEREVVDVTLHRLTPPEVVDALRSLGGTAVDIHLVEGRRPPRVR